MSIGSDFCQFLNSQHKNLDFTIENEQINNSHFWMLMILVLTDLLLCLLPCLKVHSHD